MSSDADTVKRAYEALNGGDSAAALEALDPAAEWCEHSELPEADTYRGREAIRAFLNGFLESWGDFHQETEELLEEGDRVAVLLRSAARGKGSGVEVAMRYTHVWTMRDGKGVRVDAYADRERALEALRAAQTP